MSSCCGEDSISNFYGLCAVSFSMSDFNFIQTTMLFYDKEKVIDRGEYNGKQYVSFGYEISSNA